METLDGRKLMQKFIKISDRKKSMTEIETCKGIRKFQKENGCSYEVVEESLWHLRRSGD